MASYLWTGNTDGDLSTATNYSPNGTPGAGDDVTYALANLTGAAVAPSSGTCAADTNENIDLSILGGTYTGDFINRETIEFGSFTTCTNHKFINGTTFSGLVQNKSTGTIFAGTFSGDVQNEGTINGGSFATCTNAVGATIEFTAGVLEFSGTVDNHGTIGNGGTFNGLVNNENIEPVVAEIAGGTFNADVQNKIGAYISAGTFNSTCTNAAGASVGSSASFYGVITNAGSWDGSDGKNGSQMDNTGTIESGEFRGNVNNLAGGVINFIDTFTGTFKNRKNATLNNGVINNGVVNWGTINNGQFQDAGQVNNFRTVNGGTFDVSVISSGTNAVINDGTFNISLQNGLYDSTAEDDEGGVPTMGHATVKGGTFGVSAQVTNYANASDGTGQDIIEGGDFSAVGIALYNYGLIRNGATTPVFGSTANTTNYAPKGEIAGGTWDVGPAEINNQALISGGIISTTVRLSSTSTITGGTITARLISSGSDDGIISGGTFQQPEGYGVTVLNSIDISGGTFNNSVDVNNSLDLLNSSVVSGGTFNLLTLSNDATCVVSGGTFNHGVDYMLSITNGTFNSSVSWHRTISGGTFNAGCHVYNYGPDGSYTPEISGGTFNGHVQSGDGANGYAGNVSGGTFNGELALEYGVMSGGTIGVTGYVTAGTVGVGGAGITNCTILRNGTFVGNGVWEVSPNVASQLPTGNTIKVRLMNVQQGINGSPILGMP